MNRYENYDEFDRRRRKESRISQIVGSILAGIAFIAGSLYFTIGVGFPWWVGLIMAGFGVMIAVLGTIVGLNSKVTRRGSNGGSFGGRVPSDDGQIELVDGTGFNGDMARQAIAQDNPQLAESLDAMRRMGLGTGKGDFGVRDWIGITATLASAASQPSTKTKPSDYDDSQAA